MIQPTKFLMIILFYFTCLFSQEKTFYQFKMHEFDFKGHAAKIVYPDKPHEQRYWIWRARFWGHEPQLDRALLESGFHLAFVDVADLYGSPQAVELWNRFYSYIIEIYDLNPRVVLEGMSRGGLIIYNWAVQNTDKVFCLYADAPVCDIKSLPGGLFSGPGSPQDWQKCLAAYGVDEESVLKVEMPIQSCVTIARAGIPVIHVCGQADELVPVVENTEPLAKNFKNAGGHIKIILKPGVGHHPHSLKDPMVIQDFIMSAIKTREQDELR